MNRTATKLFALVTVGAALAGFATAADSGFTSMHDMGHQSLKDRDFNRAVEAFSKAIEMRPNSAELYADRALANNGLGNLEGAISDATTALRLDAKCSAAYIVRAQARLATKNNLLFAVDDWSKVIQLDPGSVSAYSNRALVLLTMGEREQALQDLAKVKQLAWNEVLAEAAAKPVLDEDAFAVGGMTADALVGAWTVRSGSTENKAIQITFGKDGSFAFKCVGASSNGRYTVADGVLTLIYTHVDKEKVTFDMRKNIRLNATDSFKIDAYRYMRAG